MYLFADNDSKTQSLVYMQLVSEPVPWLLRPRSFETKFISDHDIWDDIHFRPRSFTELFIWDLFIWDHIHLRPHSPETFSFETTFTWVQLRPHSFYATLKWSCLDLLCIRFLRCTFHFFAGDLKFCKATIHLKFCKVTPFRVQGWLTLGCKCTHTLKQRRHQKTLHTSGLEGSVALLKCHLDQVKELCFAFLPVYFIEAPQ